MGDKALLAELEAHFKIIDANGDGFITRAELKTGLTKFGMEVDDAVVDSMLAKADTNQDGKIDYEEFLHVMGA